MKNETEITLRIGADLLAKLEYIAEKEGRSLNNHFILLARNNVAYYERTHERIPAVTAAKAQPKPKADDSDDK